MSRPDYRIYRVAEYGPAIVYRRGPWARREGCPLYVVGDERTNRHCGEFRRLSAAKRFAVALAGKAVAS